MCRDRTSKHAMAMTELSPLCNLHVNQLRKEVWLNFDRSDDDIKYTYRMCHKTVLEILSYNMIVPGIVDYESPGGCSCNEKDHINEYLFNLYSLSAYFELDIRPLWQHVKGSLPTPMLIKRMAMLD